MLGPPIPSLEPCDVVHIEWDRGHDDFDALRYVDGDEGLVIAKVHDYWPLAGSMWLRRNEVRRMEALDPGLPEVRVLDRLGVRLFTLDPALAELRNVLSGALGSAVPLAVYSRSTGSGEFSWGS